MDFYNRHIISIKDFTREEIEYILDRAFYIKNNKNPELLKGKVLATLFFEPSTRTRLSFEASITKLGGSYIGFSDASNSSVRKGETLKDTIKTVTGYCDAIVIRHQFEGAARAASEVSTVPVINAGDGSNQHPTQTLLDLFTIKEAFNKIDNLNIVLFGDLKYGRTIHSLVMALANYKVNIYLVSPEQLKLPDIYKNYLSYKKVNFYEFESLEKIKDKIDIVYVTRIQRERFGDPYEYEKVAGSYKVSLETIRFLKDAKIMHPLPRVDEIDFSVDSTENALYFKQAHNGIFVRQAIIALVTGALK